MEAEGSADQAGTSDETTSAETAQQEPAGQATQGAEAENGGQASADVEPGADVLVSDLTGREVVTPEGEEIAEIDRFVVIGGEPHVVFKRGGFFGLGSDDVAVPAAQLQVQGDQLVLSGIGTDEFDAMPEFEAETESELAADDTVRIGSAQ